MTDAPTERGGEGAWSKLRDRKVVQWGLGYSAAAWTLLQVIEYLSETYAWPPAVRQIATPALAFGLLIALVLAWYHGDKGAQKVSRAEFASLFALIFIAGGSLWWYGSRLDESSWLAGTDRPEVKTRAPPYPASIAVLPFLDLSQAHDEEYFADGMAEEVLNLLTQLPQLRVIARTSSFSFKGKTTDIATIAQMLNVAHVLEGSVRKSGDTVRITAQLIRAADSTHLWSQTYDRKMTDVFRVQDEIASAVVAALRVKLLPNQRIVNLHRATGVEAYDQYLRGNESYNRTTVLGFQEAVTAYRRAVELDPTFAEAYARLAVAEYFASEYTASVEELTAGKQRALAAAEQAVALAPELADGYTSRGWMRMRWLWNWGGATDDLKKAVTLEPGNSRAQLWYGVLLYFLGRLPDACAATTKAVDLDPLSSEAWNNLGDCFTDSGRWQEAHDALMRALALNPESMFANWSLGRLELLRGRPRQAMPAFLRTSDTSDYWKLTGTAMAEYSLGHEQASQLALQELLANHGLMAAYQIAEVYAWRREKDAAFEWLDRAYTQRDGGLTAMKADSLLASLRADPRFAAMLKKLGLPQ